AIRGIVLVRCWLQGKTSDTGEGKSSFAAAAGAIGSFKVCIGEVRAERGEGASMAVNESDALSAVHRLRWKLPIAWSGRQSACHCKNSHSVTRDQASFTA